MPEDENKAMPPALVSHQISLATGADEYRWSRRFNAALAYMWSRLLARPRYLHRERLPEKGPYVLISNHQSFLDVMLLHTLSKQNICWIAKLSLFGKPLLGEAIRRFGAIPVDRSQADLSSVKIVLTVLREGGIVGLFPEGTRVKWEKRGEVLPKAGVSSLLSRVNVPIVPVHIRGPYRKFHRTPIYIGEAFQFSKKELQELRASDEQGAAERYLLERIYGLEKALERELSGKESEA